MADVEGPLRPEDRQDTAGTRFAERHGYTRRIVEIARVQRPPYDTDRLAEPERGAAAHAADYRVVTWRDRVPDEHIEEFARLTARMSTDAPARWAGLRGRGLGRRSDPVARGTPGQDAP